jgi:tetratricopeptide (TPR) repeat protein
MKLTHILLLCCSLTTAVTGAESARTLFEQAESLARSKQPAAALAKIEQAVAELDRAHAAGEKPEWGGMSGLRLAARFARVELLDYEKSLGFCDKLSRLADSDYWRVPARLERALTYRAMGDLERAQAEYDAIAESDPRQRTSGILPQAEMVYFDLRDPPRGRPLIVAALRNEAINARERYETLRRCAVEALDDGRRDAAYRWYAMLEELPFNRPEERAGLLAQAWFELGRIEESRGRTAEAKALYRKALELPGGDMRSRVRARDALESIEYFE